MSNELVSLSQKIRRREKAIAAAARRVIKLVPALDRKQYRPLVASYAQISVMCQKLYSNILERGLFDENGEVRTSGLDAYRRMVSELRAISRELGLSPSTAAALMKESAPVLDLENMRRVDDDAEEE